jgi:hypothetical protein
VKPTSDQLLMGELRAAVGDEAAEPLAASLPQPSPSSHRAIAGGRLLMAVLAGLGVAACAFGALVLGGWWFLPGALAVVLGAMAAVVSVAFGLLSEVEAPDPAVAAQLEARGIADPERELNDLLERSQGRRPGKRVRRLFGQDAGELEPGTGDGGRAGGHQQIAWTPSSGASRPVGPRSPRRRR